ncbi:MAG: hypothetical protein JNM99_17600 [Verrucomicrobiaceae bacterium]|nr:hypothetical protein [Verrucomicrobiaceae bacterium]
MPFDPALPLPGSPLESQVIRDQFQALFNLITSITSLTTAQVDGVATLPAGSPASVEITVSGSALHFSFALPQGNDGPPGGQGPTGNDGGQGPQGNDGAQGPPGEVTALQLQDAITGTSKNSNAVPTVDITFGDPEVELLRQRLNDLINALRR